MARSRRAAFAARVNAKHGQHSLQSSHVRHPGSASSHAIFVHVQQAEQMGAHGRTTFVVDSA